jgi:hypothetical protein
VEAPAHPLLKASIFASGARETATNDTSRAGKCREPPSNVSASSELIVYHFMFDPRWDEGRKSCSLLGGQVLVHTQCVVE